MEGEYDIYDSRNGELLWRGVLESSEAVDQISYPEGVTPAEVFRDLTRHPVFIFIDRLLKRWKRFPVADRDIEQVVDMTEIPPPHETEDDSIGQGCDDDPEPEEDE